MNWFVFGWCLALAMFVSWFVERPQTTAQRFTLGFGYMVTSMGAGLLSTGNSVIAVATWMFPVVVLSVYRIVVNVELRREGKRALKNNEQAKSEWQEYATEIDGHANGSDPRRPPDNRGVGIPAN